MAKRFRVGLFLADVASALSRALERAFPTIGYKIVARADDGRLYTGYESRTTFWTPLRWKSVPRQRNRPLELCTDTVLHFYEHAMIPTVKGGQHVYYWVDGETWLTLSWGRRVTDGTKSGSRHLLLIRKVARPEYPTSSQVAVATAVAAKMLPLGEGSPITAWADEVLRLAGRRPPVFRVRYRPEVDSWSIRPERYLEGIIDHAARGKFYPCICSTLIDGVHPKHVRVFSRVMWSAMNTHPKALSRVPKLRADWEVAESNVKVD